MTRAIDKQINKGWVNLWELEEPRLYPEAIISRFFNNILDDVSWHQNIISHFHESVNDQQIRKIESFFKHSYFAWHDTTFGTMSHFDVLKKVYFRNAKKQLIKDVLFGIEPDKYSESEYRIVGVRVMDFPHWRVKKTVYKADNSV